jgi:DNA polymerase-3 subunit delta
VPTLPPSKLQAAVDSGKVPPIVVVIGDDEVAKDRAIRTLGELVEEDLRPFNVERFYATDSQTKPADVVAAVRTYAFMGSRRVVFFMRGEALFKIRARAADDGSPAEDASRADLQVLEEYVAEPDPQNCLVIVASDINRTTRLGKLLAAKATTVECVGVREERGGYVDAEASRRKAEQFVVAQVAEEGKRIDRDAVALVVDHAGFEIGRLRGDVERLVLFVGDRPRITWEDAAPVVGGEVSLDDWAVANAIRAGDAAAALRELRLALDGGAIPLMVLGQLGWMVRNPRGRYPEKRLTAAVDALFRTDQAIKRSAATPQVLLERLVVELCG